VWVTSLHWMRPWSLYTPPVAITDELLSEIFGGELRDVSYIVAALAKVDQTWWFGGNKSRNKVSVGEPAEGSLTIHKSSLMNDCRHRRVMLCNTPNPWYLPLRLVESVHSVSSMLLVSKGLRQGNPLYPCSPSSPRVHHVSTSSIL
jgi:hypothetical protein